MGKKIFVSYKYSDSFVQNLPAKLSTTARDYVDKLDGLIEDEDHIYKGEHDDEDLSHLDESTIEQKLRDRMYDSSLTIVIISKGMRENKPEREQWIPWEVSYSLKETTRGGRTSQTNAILAVVLPDEAGGYDYFMEYNSECNSTRYHTDILFPILRKNMFNRKETKTRDCNGTTVHIGNFSYIHCVKWEYFKNYVNRCIDIAYEIYEKNDEYNIVKNLE